MTMLIGKTVMNHLRNLDDDDGDSGGGEMKQKIMSAFMFRDDDSGHDNNHDNDYVLPSQAPAGARKGCSPAALGRDKG